VETSFALRKIANQQSAGTEQGFESAHTNDNVKRRNVHEK
jgi:hypothetical protein